MLKYNKQYSYGGLDMKIILNGNYALTSDYGDFLTNGSCDTECSCDAECSCDENCNCPCNYGYNDCIMGA